MKIGNDEIIGLYIGNDPVNAAMLGNAVVYQSSGDTPTPVHDYTSVIVNEGGLIEVTMWFTWDASNEELVGLYTGTTLVPDEIESEAGTITFMTENGDVIYDNAITYIDSIGNSPYIETEDSTITVVNPDYLVVGGEVHYCYYGIDIAGDLYTALSSLNDGDVVRMYFNTDSPS